VSIAVVASVPAYMSYPWALVVATLATASTVLPALAATGCASLGAEAALESVDCPTQLPDSAVALPEEEEQHVHLLQHELRVTNREGGDHMLAKTPMAAAAAGATTTAPAATMEGGTTTAPPTGVTMNAVGDLKAFVSAVITNVASVAVFLAIFSWLRLRYPIMYGDNSLKGIAPDLAQTMFGWFQQTIGMSVDEVADRITLDHAMMLEFTHLCMKILAIVGLPMLLVIGPMNCLFGGYAAGEDHLSYLSFGNVENGSKLYWMHSIVIWYVVLVVRHSVFSAMRRFLPRRTNWLRNMPTTRANTVLVESIPEECQTEAKLKSYWEMLMPNARIKDVYIAKDTSGLQALMHERDAARRTKHEVEAKLHKDGGERPTVSENFMGARVDAIEYYSKRIETLDTQVVEERSRIQEASKSLNGEVNSSSAFLTFEKRSDAELCLRLDHICHDLDAWELYTPPEQSDILWNDLTQDDTMQEIRTILGYLVVVGLYFLYMPCVIGMTNLAKIIDMGVMQPVWQGLAPTLGLQFMVAFLPTFLLLIFRSFFTLRADAWAQHKLQVWYYWFQIVFVILATAVGQNVRGFTKTIVEEPFSIFSVMADTMPYATHFYMNFLVLQWATHAMGSLRYVPLAKYLSFCQLWEVEEAKQMAEPEDQDYYGMGGRSARWTIAMTVGIVYGTLSPPINLLCFINFAICRVVYGYLFIFAEHKKADLGGVFWVKQLEHLLIACIIYCILMTGVLLKRSDSWCPGVISAAALVYSVMALNQFTGAHAWEKIPYEDIMKDKEHHERKATEGVYVQPEMQPGA